MTEALVQFIRDRLDEDASRASNWHDLECEIHTHLGTGLVAAVAASRMFADAPGAVCDCGGPARVLADVEAKRLLLAEHLPSPYPMANSSKAYCDCQAQDGVVYETYPCLTARLLALPYADHSDYREEWRPVTG
ncbi:hypothetical protein GCM10010331_49310 [Streptomyces xanthochromogenes]|uniref:DUF6221 family protein n=1 Tax=Streptomyces xanthochromogenes TaxID=67384 RepID=UPI00167870E7|nr:DUF6221 family protein [Streptomyces xanthochromogenes]GHB55613.1 hypothetical protein GCM10010331_49310 [Streptomyces xanthochromogenes]